MSEAPLLHERAIVDPGCIIGKGTRVSAFAHVVAGATVGRDCTLWDHVLIDGGAAIGDRVTIRSCVQVWAGVRIEDDVIIGPNVAFAPPVESRDARSVTRVGKRVRVGANSTIHVGVVIGQDAIVDPGSVVTKDVPPFAVVRGNPAAIHGYVTDANRKSPGHESPAAPDHDIAVPGVRRIEFPLVQDLRGELTFGEVGKHLPFAPKRIFAVFRVPSPEIRGEHAHKALHQLLICTSGSVSVMVDDGHRRDTAILDHPRRALYIPPMIWASQYHYSADAVLVVLASDVYDANDYIREYDQFIAAVGDGRSAQRKV